jgi:transposase-like protein
MSSFKSKLATAKEQVRDAYQNGATLREIAEVHNVSSGTVRNVLIEMGEKLRRPGRKGGSKVEKALLPVGQFVDPTPPVQQ